MKLPCLVDSTNMFVSTRAGALLAGSLLQVGGENYFPDNSLELNIARG